VEQGDEDHITGVYSAREFVNWYNGHPDFRDLNPDLSGGHSGTAVIIGNGNVALDCARMLVKSPNDLENTYISEHALEALKRRNGINKVIVLGRRGAVQSAFTIKELRELTKLKGVKVTVRDVDMEDSLTPASIEEKSNQRAKRRIFDLLTKIQKNSGELGGVEEDNDAKHIELWFLTKPLAMFSNNPLADGPVPVGGVEIARMQLEGRAGKQSAIETGDTDLIPCDMVLQSIGYRSVEMEGVPFDHHRGIMPNAHGRVLDISKGDDGHRVPGLYVAGWLKRGPSGIIGTNIADARETVHSVLEDAAAHALPAHEKEDRDGKSAMENVRNIVLKQDPGHVLVSWQNVEQLEAHEQQRGGAAGKPREKLTRVEEMLDFVSASQKSTE